MLNEIKKLLGKEKTYDNQKEDLNSVNVKKRMTLAQDTATNKEILYYLAEQDPDPEVRKAVVENKSLPMQVTPILAKDADDDVRLALAGRLVDLLPELSEDKQSQLYAFVVQALGTLALDEVLKIRKALSSTLKDHAYTPPKIAGQLARDVEREVSEPILRFCVALSDEDLVDILKDHPESWVVEAIAERETVSEEVSEAVIDTEDRPGGAALIENEGALITEELLQAIVIKAREFPEWQEPIAMRQSLPVSVAKELAEFVDESVRDILVEREDFDEEVTEEITEAFRRRIEFASQQGKNGESVEERLVHAEQGGRLNGETISDALAMRDNEFVNAALAKMAGTDVATVVKIFEMKAPKAIVALAWKADLSMRLALELQKEMAKVPHEELIYPREGTEYPLTEEELNFQLEFLGLKVA